MKQLALIVIAFITFSCSQAQKAQKTSFSQEALSEKLLAADGSQVAFKDILKKYKGKNLVIEVWASWCGDCVKAMPKLKELQAANPNVSYLFLSADKTADKWKAGIEKHELKGDHFMMNDGMKGVFGKAIDLDWIPRYIVIDRFGTIVLYRAIETDFDKINEKVKETQYE
ncbi:TlpA family protein disulfide reductase [Flavobacterium sharifuzzamanii]|uniref:TlpA family protein disulfide reductase n=1 Tax=Flavobacterium sharifuzzamanii TaxID=2211133 RepID=UPI000DAC2F00|nr:TlpA disulfide reductase family protein [Flavobacterium sharifuzzamanii]KAF2081794.1 TlpA family protein disulfide reductase [Flavobacterium sharifuzzamanii]